MRENRSIRSGLFAAGLVVLGLLLVFGFADTATAGGLDTDIVVRNGQAFRVTRTDSGRVVDVDRIGSFRGSGFRSRGFRGNGFSRFGSRSRFNSFGRFNRFNSGFGGGFGGGGVFVDRSFSLFRFR